MWGCAWGHFAKNGEARWLRKNERRKHKHLKSIVKCTIEIISHISAEISGIQIWSFSKLASFIILENLWWYYYFHNFFHKLYNQEKLTSRVWVLLRLNKGSVKRLAWVFPLVVPSSSVIHFASETQGEASVASMFHSAHCVVSECDN